MAAPSVTAMYALLAIANLIVSCSAIALPVTEDANKHLNFESSENLVNNGCELNCDVVDGDQSYHWCHGQLGKMAKPACATVSVFLICLCLPDKLAGQLSDQATSFCSQVDVTFRKSVKLKWFYNALG
uniref:Uncharacterized protein n=1 Tax=Oryza brachyantha TaxID=4533 RepID=J3MLZ9_ORYBR